MAPPGQETIDRAVAPAAVPEIRLTAAAWQGGREFILSQEARKPTIVFAMASWCISCVAEAKALIQLHREAGDRVNIVVLDIDPDDTEESLERFAKAVGGAPGCGRSTAATS
jgi:thiol-disulfide isomerase/thioredoxin